VTVLLEQWPHGGERPTPSAPGNRLALDPQHPWPGLPAYDEASSAFFYGRGEEAAELLRLIRVAPLTAVYGKSGLGKTSLLQAGLFPLLRAEHFLPVYLRMDFSEGEPLGQIMRRLEEELTAVQAEYPAPEPGESVWEFLHRRDLEIWSVDNFPLVPVLIVDQFEELFSRSGNADVIRDVFDGLADLIENRIPAALASDAAAPRRSRLDLLSQRYRIVLSFREDFLPDIRMWERQVPSLLRHYLRLEPMSRRCAIEAVERAGMAVLDAGVAPAIVDFVARRDRNADTATADTVVEPVLLSLCCYQLNRRRKPDARIDQVLVEEAGQDILDSFYREALDDPEVRGEPDAAHFIEDYLIQGDHFRGDYPKEEALEERKLTAMQLAALTDRHRLLRIVAHADTARIELIHDRLVPVVRKARDERRTKAHREEQERLAREAQEERDLERARSEELQRQRDVASRSLKIAARRRNMALVAAVAAIILVLIVLRRGEQLQEASRAAQIMALAEKTSQLVTGRLALQVGSEPQEQIMYQGLAAYRLASQGAPQARAAGLLALHSAMEVSAHLRKALRIADLTPTPALAYSPDGETLAAGGRDGKIRLLDIEDYTVAGVLDCGAPAGQAAWTLAFNAGGTRLVAGYVANADDAIGTGLVCVFDVAQHALVRKWSATDNGGGTGDVYSVAYGGFLGAEIVVSGGDDKVLRIFDVQTGRVDERAQDNPVVAVAVSADSRTVAAGGDDGTIRMWNRDKPSAPPVELTGHRATVQQVAFSPGSPDILVSGGDDGRVMVWAWNGSAGCLAQQSKLQTARIYGVAINADGIIAAAGADGAVRLFRLDDAPCAPGTKSATSAAGAAEVTEFDIIDDGMLAGHAGVVWAAAFNSQGDRLASAGFDGSIRIWGPKTGGFSLGQLTLDAPAGDVTSVAISPDMRFVAAGDSDGYIHLWERPQENPALMLPATARWKAGNDAISHLVYTGMGDRVALLSAAADGAIKRWDPESRDAIAPDLEATAAAPGATTSMAASRDGRLLAAGTADGSVRLWDVASGRLRRTMPAPAYYDELNAISFSRDGRHLALGSLAGLRILDLDTPEDVGRAIQGHGDAVVSLAQSEERWFSAGKDGSVLEWTQGVFAQQPIRDGDEFEFRMGFGRDLKQLTSLSTSADGRLILSGGSDGHVQLWDGANHVLIGPRFRGHGTRAISAVALAADGSFFVTADAETILIWPRPDGWADIICSKLTSNMSEQQWRDWVSPDIPYQEQCSGLTVLADGSAAASR
jgi:WD40 repeat protein